MKKIVITAIASLLLGYFLLWMIDIAFVFSKHPFLSVLVRIVFGIVIFIPLVLNKREILIYLFILSFPFMRLAFNGIGLMECYALCFAVYYRKEIWKSLFIKNHIYKLGLLLLMFSWVLSTFIAKHKYAVMNESMFFISLLVIYCVLISYMKTEKEIKRIMQLFTFVTLVGLLVSFTQLIFGIDSVRFFWGEYNPNTDIYGVSKRIPSFFNEAQATGQFFGIMSILLIGFSSDLFRNRVVTRLLGVFCIIGLLFSITRIAIFSFIFGMLTYMTLARKKTQLAVFMIAVLILMISFPTIKEIMPKGVTERFTSYNQSESFNNRFELWKESLPIFYHHPFGVGLGGLNLYDAGIKQNVRLMSIFEEFPQTRYLTHFENSYLHILYSLGIFGFLGFLIIIIKHLLISRKLSLLKKHPEFHNSSNSLFAAMVIWGLTVFTSPQVREAQPMVLFVILLSIISARYFITFANES